MGMVMTRVLYRGLWDTNRRKIHRVVHKDKYRLWLERVGTWNTSSKLS